MFFLFISCGEEPSLSSSKIIKNDSVFFKQRKTKDRDRKQILEASHKNYSGSSLCLKNPDCKQICRELFLFEFDRQDCFRLQEPQVFRFQKIYGHLSQNQKEVFKEIDFFDLRVFFNLSPQPFLQIIKSLGSLSVKKILAWILEDWQVAEVFYKEDFDFLFLDIFLNKLNISPISSLRSDILGGKTFFELSWLKQNDSALLWISSYLEDKICFGESEDLENCVLGQYCQIQFVFQEGFQKEFMAFDVLKSLTRKKSHGSQKNLKTFCLGFCSEDKMSKFCSN